LGHNEIEHFLDPVFGIANPNATEAAVTTAGHGLELTLAAVSLLTAALGFFIAYLFYYRKPGTAAALAQRAPALYRLVDNKFYIDEIYGAVIVGPLLMFSRLFLSGLIDSGIVNGSGATAGATTRGFSALVRRVQSGNIRSYAGWLALGAAAVLLVMIFGRSLWPH
jgi:NADH-quinone oxidoreductase subunit L